LHRYGVVKLVLDAVALLAGGAALPVPCSIVVPTPFVGALDPVVAVPLLVARRELFP